MSRALPPGVSSGGRAQVSGGLTGPKGRQLMSGMQWFLGTVLAVLYLVFIFTVGLMTFRKGHYVLGVLGIFVPLLWLIGAFLPDRGGGMTPEI